jgi:hypothetical protein
MAAQSVTQLVESLSQASHDDVVHALLDSGFFRKLGQDVPKSLSSDARLFNFRYSTVVEFQGGRALYIPVAVTDTRAGRSTVYELPVGEKTLMGIYVLNNLIYEHYLTRIDEETYDTEITGCNSGQVIQTARSKLERIDERVGLGRLRPIDTAVAASQPTPIWILWSCIKIN